MHERRGVPCVPGTGGKQIGYRLLTNVYLQGDRGEGRSRAQGGHHQERVIDDYEFAFSDLRQYVQRGWINQLRVFSS
jgi:hypothetical protein